MHGLCALTSTSSFVYLTVSIAEAAPGWTLALDDPEYAQGDLFVCLLTYLLHLLILNTSLFIYLYSILFVKALSTKPVAYLVCNGSPPVGEKPSLMTFREVETLFHEFGHGLQHMLTRVEYGDAAGISGVEWDAVELPSQFMENWAYDKPTLYKFAKHYSSGDPLPLDLFDKVKKAKNFQSGLGMVRQLLFSAVDMKLHSEYDPSDASQSPFDVFQSIATNYAVVPPLKDDRFLCSFSHIFAGGYSAGYFSYKWAEVMSADAFAAFEEAGLDNESAVKEMGKKFRDTVLSKGGSRHPALVYRDFRGRSPSPDALLRHSGLVAAAVK